MKRAVRPKVDIYFNIYVYMYLCNVMPEPLDGQGYKCVWAKRDPVWDPSLWPIHGPGVFVSAGKSPPMYLY